MRITRIFFPTITNDNNVVLDEKKSHHLIRVLRHKIDQRVILFNNFDGLEYYCKIIDTNPKNTVLGIISSAKKQSETHIKIHLFQALSTKDKIEAVIKQSTQLGISSFTPIITKYVKHPFRISRSMQKIEHWKKIAINASEQSGRVFVPTIQSPLSLSSALTTTSSGIKIFLSPHNGRKIASLKNLHPQSKEFSIYIGPEGGFSKIEENFNIHRCYPVKIGPRILRTETAPLVVISLLQNLWGDY